MALFNEKIKLPSACIGETNELTCIHSDESWGLAGHIDIRILLMAPRELTEEEKRIVFKCGREIMKIFYP